MWNQIVMGENLRRARQERGLSMDEVAQWLVVSRQAYNGYELGNKLISIGSLIVLSEHYDVSVDELAGNPNVTARPKAVAFRSLKLVNGVITPGKDVIISTEKESKILLTDEKANKIYVFGLTNANIPGTTMLFTYMEKSYMSKIHIAPDGQSVFIDADNVPIILSKRESSAIFYIGTMMTVINFEFDYFSHIF